MESITRDPKLFKLNSNFIFRKIHFYDSIAAEYLIILLSCSLLSSMADAADQTTEGRSVYDDALLLKSACFFRHSNGVYIERNRSRE